MVTITKKTKHTQGVQAGMLALALVFGMAACSGKARQGGDAEAATEAAKTVEVAAKDASKDAAKDTAKGAAVPAVTRAVTAASNFEYELNKERNAVIITRFRDDAKIGAHLVVPAEIEGFPVVAFLASHNKALRNQQPPLQSVVFPDSIIYLGESGIRVSDEYGYSPDYDYEEYAEFRDREYEYGAAFSENESLKSIVFPKNLKILPKYIVGQCPNLKPEGITWPETLEIIGNYAFSGNSFTELVIPDGVKIIGASAFYGNPFTELVIPDGVKIIGDEAFARNETLKSVTIPDSVEIIGGKVFLNCLNLTTVNLPSHPITYIKWDILSGTDYGTFEGCTKLSLAARKVIKDSGYSGTF